MSIHIYPQCENPKYSRGSTHSDALVFSIRFVHYGADLHHRRRCPVKTIRALPVLFLFLAGCSPVREQLNAWHGARLDELISQAGPPSSVSSDLAGNKFYHWLEDRGKVYTYGGMVSLSCQRIFGVDDREIITSVTWSGNCTAAPDSPWQHQKKSGE